MAIQRIQHSDVVQFYAVFCKIDRIPDLSVVGLLRFLYLSLQICSHECDNRTNEVFLCLNAEDSGWWRENLINIPAEASPPLRVPALLDRVGGGALSTFRGWSRVWWKNPPIPLLLKVPLSPFVTPGIEMCFCVRYLVLFALLWKTPNPFCICLYISTYLYSNLSCLMLG